jgi:hypothetical protein
MQLTRARKEHRKFPFLKALSVLGSISRAAKATRVSRDFVYDCKKNDPTFARGLAHALRQYKNQEFADIESTLVFFTDIVRPIIPAECWPRIASELAIAMSNLKNDLRGERRRAVPLTGEVAEVSLSPKRFEGVAILDRDIGNSANDL